MPYAIPGRASSTLPAQSRAGGSVMYPGPGSANYADSGGAQGGSAGGQIPFRSGGGFLRVVTPGQRSQMDADETARRANQNTPERPPDLNTYIRHRWEVFRNHRNQGANPINYRLLRAQRMFEGKYDPEKLAAIKEFGGSEVYSRLAATKCRGATSLLRDVYLGQDRPWDVEPQPDPPVPDEVRASIIQLVAGEVHNQMTAGMQAPPQPGMPPPPPPQPPTQDQVKNRIVSLTHAAQQAARRIAMMQANAAADKMDDILISGGFYDALAEFRIDLPLYPYAVLKGPVVRMLPKLTWINGKPSIQTRPQLFWERVNPFFLCWTPGAATLEEAEIIERKRMTRADLNDLLGLPGYDVDAVRGALEAYSRGLRDWMDYPDTEQAFNEQRESPYLNYSNMIDCAEYHGCLQGQVLWDNGVDPKLCPDPDTDYMVQSWVVGQFTIKTQINPSPRKRHPYYMTSFEKVPGTVMGHGVPDIIEDLQEVCNASLRALVNNMAISSGPQVVVNTERLAPTENASQMYPWKRWYVVDDPMANMREPITFFQPQSNVQELLAVYSAVSNLADDISAIPRYVTGAAMSGGAGRTASGLGMLMNNSQKVLQTVAANIDTDVIKPALSGLYDMIMLTDQSGMLTGEEQIKVNGAVVALAKETERQKQLQFLQITANPIDAPIVGPLGRSRVLRAVAQNMGLPDDILPPDDQIEAKVRAQEQMQNIQAQMQQMTGQGPGGPPGQPNRPGGNNPANQAQGNQPPQATPERLSDNAPPVNSFQAQPGAPPSGGY